MQLQVELHARTSRTTIDFLEPHCAFFTFAENYGNPDCGLPVQDRFPFQPDAPAGGHGLLERPRAARRRALHDGRQLAPALARGRPSTASATAGASTTSS